MIEKNRSIKDERRFPKGKYLRGHRWTSRLTTMLPHSNALFDRASRYSHRSILAIDLPTANLQCMCRIIERNAGMVSDGRIGVSSIDLTSQGAAKTCVRRGVRLAT